MLQPSFKANLTGFQKTRLRKVHFCPRLAETKREKIILDNMNSRICLGSSRYWLHKSDLITTKTAYYAISWNQWERELNVNITIVIHFPPMDIQSNLMGPINKFGTTKICPRGSKNATIMAQKCSKMSQNAVLRVPIDPNDSNCLEKIKISMGAFNMTCKIPW